jgi:hypothetical protein
MGDRSDGPKLRALLGEAIHDIDWAGFGDLIAANLRIVIATHLPERAAPALRGFFCNFEDLEFDRRALSCRLLWYSKYYELTQGGRGNVTPADEGSVAWACFETEAAFVRKFPDNAGWLAFLEEHHRPRLPRVS